MRTASGRQLIQSDFVSFKPIDNRLFKSLIGVNTMGLGVSELLLILAIVAMIFGTKKLRNIGGDVGGAIRSFRQSMSEGGHDQDSATPTGQTAAANPTAVDNAESRS